MASQAFDVVVIGSGPGGYVAAIRFAQLGFSTALVEKEPTLGGTCLNVGCIPSKALLDSSEHFFKASHEFDQHGINVTPKLDFKKMVERKAGVVKANVDGVAFLMKKNKIKVLQGWGSLKDKNTVLVTPEAGDAQAVTAKHIVVATGSAPATIPNVAIDGKRVISSTEALELPAVPKKMLVIGAGYIGLEMSSVYARLGCEVHVVEYADCCLPAMDKDLGKEIEKILKKELKVTFHFKHKVTGVKATAKQVTLTADDPTGESQTFKADYCLVAVGRTPYTEGLGLDNVGITPDERGFLAVENNFRVKGTENIYAIGDVIGGKMLAHKAEEEGVYLAEHLAGQHPHLNYHLIPGVVYTWPEVASVGYTEAELKELGTPYKVGKFPLLANGRARASNDTHGFVKWLAHQDTDELLGFHMIGARAADLITEAVTAMTFRASAEDIAMMSHAHPTFGEAVKEAALDATGKRALHI